MSILTIPKCHKAVIKSVYKKMTEFLHDVVAQSFCNI